MSDGQWENMMLDWLDASLLKVLISIGVLGSFALVVRVTRLRIHAKAGDANFKEDTAVRAIVAARVAIAVVGVLIIVVVWGIDVSALVVFATTTLTVLGVALFASWSMLSKVTAFFILLLHPSYRRGSYIRVFDADNYIEGYIADVTLFNTRLVTENRETVLYPNNLILGRPALQIGSRLNPD